MSTTRTAIALALALAAAPALAFHCPTDMQKIDAALAANPQLSDADLTKVKELRAEGEAQHKAGQHADSVETLGEAMIILGIK